MLLLLILVHGKSRFIHVYLLFYFCFFFFFRSGEFHLFVVKILVMAVFKFYVILLVDYRLIFTFSNFSWGYDFAIEYCERDNKIFLFS